jgi:hypothetical protein
VPEEGVPLYRRRGEEKGERNWMLLTTITPIKQQLPVTVVFKVKNCASVPEEGVPLYRRRGEEKGERTWTLLTTITPIKRQLLVTALYSRSSVTSNGRFNTGDYD